MAKDKEDEKKLSDKVNRRFIFARDEQQDLFDNFAMYRTLYASKITSPANYAWQNQLFNPYVFSVIRSVHSRMVGNNPAVTLQATSEKTRPHVRPNQSLLDWEMQDPEFLEQYLAFEWNRLMFGKGFAKLGWKYEKEVEIEEHNEDGKVTTKKIIRGLQNKATIYAINPAYIFVGNKNRSYIHEQPWVIELWYPTLGELKQINEDVGYDRYQHLDEIESKLGAGVNQQNYGFDVDDKSTSLDPDSMTLEVLVHWDQQDNTVTEIVRNYPELVIRHEDNPYWHGMCPIIDSPCFPEANNFWPMGLVQPIEDLQKALNNALNHYLDAADYELSPTWVKTAAAQVQDWELVARPNAIVSVIGSIDQIKRLDTSDTGRSALPMMKELKDTISGAVGVTDFLRSGGPLPGLRGASAFQAAQQSLDQGLSFLLFVQENVGLRRIAEMMIALNAQFVRDEQEINIDTSQGVQYVKVKPNEVMTGFKVKAVPNSSKPRNVLIRQQNLQSLIQMVQKEKDIAIDKAPLYSELMTTMGINDLNQIIPRDMDEAIEENRIMVEEKKDVKVEFNDNHQQHITAHQYELLNEHDPDTIMRIIQHIQDHEKWIQAQDPNLYRNLIQKATGIQPEPLTIPPNTMKNLSVPGAQQQGQDQQQQPQQDSGQVPPMITSQEPLARQEGQLLAQPTASLSIPAAASGPLPNASPLQNP